MPERPFSPEYTLHGVICLTRGTGKIVVNGSEPRAYFKTDEFANAALSPLKTVEMADQVDITVKAQGGGLNGQAGAVRLGIARALEKLNADLRVPPKHDGHMKRDPRSPRETNDTYEAVLPDFFLFKASLANGTSWASKSIISELLI